MSDAVDKDKAESPATEQDLAPKRRAWETPRVILADVHMTDHGIGPYGDDGEYVS